ncbi:hypothetical protein H4R18_002154 [Coemansia javaensis]|uniref:Uncharacterized protein n=1 Tax=Coemansia javaensis TaxID=2761396 RepID=A0A9W8LJJ9_9FUNG|nr:hypothetical protein H4R18_002154 [Coemansia javaensis]
MADSDDFTYNSIVSEPGGYSELLSTARAGHDDDGAASDAQDLRAGPDGAADSTPSLAVSTPTSDRFQLEYDRERGSPRFGSAHSHAGLKSGVYASNSDSDFATRLREEVVVSEKWSAVGNQSSPEPGLDAAEDSALLQLDATDERHAPSAPTTPMPAPDDGGSAAAGPPETPKMVRSQSDRSGNATPGLRSALRGSRPAPLTGAAVQFDADDGGISSLRRVLFADAQPPANPDAPAAATRDGATTNSSSSASGSTSEESVVFGPLPPDTPTGGGESTSTQPLDATDGGDVDPDEYADAATSRPPANVSPSQRVISGTTGVGVAGGMFSRFTDWSRARLGARSPAAAGPAAPRPDQSAGAAAAASVDSSQTASTASPVRTEPMRSQVLSTPGGPTTTTTPGKALGVTPGGSPRSAGRRGSQTPSRSVNPLTRHLAMKAMQSTPGWSPSAGRGGAGAGAGASSTGLLGSGGDGSSASLADSVDSAMVGLAELQRQFDGFANQLKHDASAVQAEVHESEQAWADLNTEVQALRAQLAGAEAAQDLLQRQLRDADQERAEWELERDRLEDDKAALQDSVDRWRQRIGAAETERQGAWEEGSQSRQELLRAIVALEDQLAAAVAAARGAEAAQAQAEAQHREKYETWAAERQEMLDNLDEAMNALYDFENESQQLQAEVSDRQAELSDCRAMLDDANSRVDAAEAARRVALDAAAAQAAAVAADCERRVAAAEARAAEQDSANALLREALEDLTERNRELKRAREDQADPKQQQQQSREESRFFATAIGDDLGGDAGTAAGAPAASDAAMERLRKEHRDQLQRVNNDCQVMVETMEELNESNNRHKAKNAELAAQVEAARAEVRALRAQAAEHEREHVQADGLVQRAARLETELADLRESGEAAGLQRENAYLQQTVADLEQELRRQNSESDALRQAAAAKDVQLDDALGELARLQEASARRAASDGGKRPPGAGGAAAALDRARADVAAREEALRQMQQRRSLVEKEQRLLAADLRDSLLHNATLRTEMAEILMRRAGLARGLQQRADDASMASGLLSHVPSTSQLMDGTSRFVRSLDRHLDEVANIIEDDAPAPAPAPTKRRLLTPIHEGARAPGLRDAATQCGDAAELDQELRAALAGARQERDQFRASHEEAAEREARLVAQVEELDEQHERMRAERITTARVALRVGRQLGVLRRALAALAAPDASSGTAAGNNNDDGASDPIGSEDALGIAEEGEMVTAAFDRPLDDADCELFGLDPGTDGNDARERLGRGELSCDWALDRIGQLVSQAHLDLRRVRREVGRAHRERARLLRRVADSERRKLPSYELSAMLGRSHAEGLDDAEPPASLLLPDESAIVAEVAARRQAEQAGERPADAALRGRVAAAAEVARLSALLARRERQLRAAEADVAKFEELNRELVQRLDRAISDRVRAQQECTVAARRASVRSASRAATPHAATPGGATDWDDVDSIARELERCAHRNIDYFGAVEQLCSVLSQHAADRSTHAPEPGDSAARALLGEVAAALGVPAPAPDAPGGLRAAVDAVAAAVRSRQDSTELGAQFAQAQAQLTKKDSTIRLLNETVSRLRQESMRLDVMVHEATLERDGWHQEVVALRGTANDLSVENDELKHALASGPSAALRRACKAQVEISAWAARTWSAVVCAIAGPGGGAALSAQRDALCRAAEELDAGIARAMRQARDLHQAHAADGDDDVENLSGALDTLMRDLDHRFSGTWRDRVRDCIVALAAASAGGPETPPATNSSASSGGGGGSGSGTTPRISSRQKAMIRENYAWREQEIARKYQAKIDQLSVQHRERETALKTTAEQQAKKIRDQVNKIDDLIREARYLRCRIQSEVNRHRSVAQQKQYLLGLIGGHEGMYRCIDAMPAPAISERQVRRQLVLRRWRLVVLAVRMRMRLKEMVDERQRARDIKAGVETRNPAAAAAGGGGGGGGGGARPGLLLARPTSMHTVRFQPHHHVGLRAAPITPSRLRNRSSDVASSASSLT